MKREKSTVPEFFIVDISDVLRTFAGHPAMLPLYPYFPLQDMILCILSVNAYEDNDEFFWNELESRFSQSDIYERLDYDVIALLYELLITQVDTFINLVIPQHVDTSEYVFERWLGYSSIVMQRDANAREISSSLPPKLKQLRNLTCSKVV